MINTKTLQKILIVLLVVLIAIVFITVYKMQMTTVGEPVPGTDAPQATTTDEFGGATPEELQQMLDAIAPEDGAGGLSPEDMEAALLDIRKGEAGTEAEADITPEGEVAPLTEAEIQARLEQLKTEEPSDNDTPITPE